MAILDNKDQSSMADAPLYIIRPSIVSVGVDGMTEFWGLSRLFFRVRNEAPEPAKRWMSVVKPYENL